MEHTRVREFVALSPNSRVWGEIITEPLLTVAQVAAILQIREKLVRNHIKEKRLKAVKIGKYWRIKAEDLSDFIEGKTGDRMPESTVPSQLDGDDPELTPDSESL
jgi:excisionase family DNA binding protein